MIGAGLLAAVIWNLVTWRLGLPSSSGHALVGGLVGAALVAGGIDAVNWGGLDGWHPVGVLGTLIALAVSPLLGALAAACSRSARCARPRGARRGAGAARSAAGEWAMSAALAFSHGANDAQKSVGVIAALLVADGRIDSLAAPLWATLACAAALTAGTALGGWGIVRTVGRGSTASSRSTASPARARPPASSSAPRSLGAPVVDDAGRGLVGRRRGRRAAALAPRHWAVVRHIGLGWLITMPATRRARGGHARAWRSLS